MFSTLRTRFGIPGVISVIALVFAMLGGAYAANNSSGGGKSTASAKAKKGPRGPKGATGPQGPAGPQGAAGAKGDAGANGSNGTNGTNGTSAEAVSFSGAKGGCTEGGTEVKSAKPTTFVCNGKKGENGQTGFTEVLPAGKTETGTFTLLAEVAGLPVASVSFPIPLADPLGEGDVHLIAPNGEELLKEGLVTPTEVPPTDCGSGIETPGGPEINAANPQAAPGNLCVYLGGETEEVTEGMGSQLIADPSYECRAFGCLGEGAGASIAGARIYAVEAAEGAAAWGTWAVTAPAS
jgi:hypothetical protein